MRTRVLSALVCGAVFFNFAALALGGALPAMKIDLQKAIDEAAGSKSKTLELERGFYELSEPLKLSSKHSGLTIKSKGADSSEVVISGGRSIGGWKRNPDGSFETRVPGEREVGFLVIGGKRVDAARSGYVYVIPDFTNKRGNSFSVRNCDIPELLALSDEGRESVWADIYVGWSFFRVAIERLEVGADSTRVYFKGPKLTMRFGYYPRVIFHNIPSLLKDKPGFVFDSRTGKLRCIPPSGTNPMSDSVRYPFFDTVMFAAGSAESPVENLTIESVTFVEGARRKRGDGSWGEHRQADPASGGFMVFDNVRGLVIRGCRIADCDMYAVWLRRGVWDAEVSDCEFSSVNAAVRVGEVTHGARRTPKIPGAPQERDGVSTGRVNILNNIIYNYGTWAKSACAIVVYDSNRVRIEHNDIFHGYYSGISCGFTFGTGKTNNHHNIIKFNRIQRLSFGHTSDLGGIYTLGVQPHSQIFGNHVSDVHSHLYGGNGIYNDEGSSGWTVSGNLVERVDGVGYSHAFGSDMIVENNLILSGGKCAFALPNPSRGKSSLAIRSNVVVFTDEKSSMWGYGEPRPGATNFSKNLYWNETGPVKFNKYSAEQWREMGYDVDGVFDEKPDVAALVKGAAIEKINFKPLRVSEAGVAGKMKARAREILSGYKFPPVVKNPRYPPFDYGIREDFSNTRGETYLDLKTAEFVEDRGARVLKLASTAEKRFGIRGKLKVENDCLLLAKFKVKLSKDSTFRIELASSSGSSQGVLIDVGRGFLRGARKMRAKLPEGEWLIVEARSVLNSASPSRDSEVAVFDSGGREIARMPVRLEKPFSRVSRMYIHTPKGSAPLLLAGFSVENLPPPADKTAGGAE